MTCCPSCGFNLTRDEVITRDGFMLDPRASVHFQDDDLGLTTGEALTLYAIAGAGGRPIKRETIAARVSESYDPNIVAVFVTRARRKLVAHHAPIPFRTVHGRGYAWGQHG